MSQQIVDLSKLDDFAPATLVKKAARMSSFVIELPISLPAKEGDVIEFYKTKLPDTYVIKIKKKVK